MYIQDKNIVDTRERLNQKMSKLTGISRTKRSLWFDKRRYNNI